MTQMNHPDRHRPPDGFQPPHHGWPSPPVTHPYMPGAPHGGRALYGPPTLPAHPAPAWITLCAAAMLVVGAALPWVDVGLVQVSGLEGDGWFVLVGAVVIGVLAGSALAARERRGLYVSAAVINFLLGCMVVYYLVTLNADELDVLGHRMNLLGAGLIVCLVAVAVIAGSTLWGAIGAASPRPVSNRPFAGWQYDAAPGPPQGHGAPPMPGQPPAPGPPPGRGPSPRYGPPTTYRPPNGAPDWRGPRPGGADQSPHRPGQHGIHRRGVPDERGSQG